MKRTATIVVLVVSLSLPTFGQSIEENLRRQILQIEANDSLRYGQKVTNLRIVAFEYTTIPIRDWWKQLYDTHKQFDSDMKVLNDILQNERPKDSRKADSLARSQPTEKAKTSFDGITYFKTKYEQADPAQKVYQVRYQISYKLGSRNVQGDPLREAFYVNDLSRVKSF